MAVTHGGRGAFIGSFDARLSPGPVRLDLRGYRHILRTPRRNEMFRVDGRPPAEVLPRTQQLMGVLGYMMHDTRAADTLQPLLNPNLPSGYTYLLQFIAHDCVQTTTPFWALSDAMPQPRNGRLSRLRLETLYGEGPTDCPHVYAPDDKRDTVRTRLRLGPMRSHPMSSKPDGPLRDIARVAVPRPGLPGAPPPACPYSTTAHPHRAEPPFSDPLIADVRNEDNALLAQVTVLFHLLHNTIIGLLGLPDQAGGATLEPPHASIRRFVLARAATTMIYRHILREDLLQRLLHREVWSSYRMGGPGRVLDRRAGARRGFVSVPLEFSHAAVRFAHSMVRPHYATTDGFPALDLESALLSTSARGPARMPLSKRWILRWGNFFRIPVPQDHPGPPASLNLSLRIGPRYTVGLTSALSFPPVLPGAPPGVAFQDLMSAALAGLWSVPALYAALRERMAQRGWDAAIFDGSPLATPEGRLPALRNWLQQHRIPALCDGDLQAIAADPPLPFYVQFEAAHDMAGERLGLLGSILVGDVLFGAMLDDPLPGEQPGATLQANLAALTAGFGCPGCLSTVPEITDMAGLILFLAEGNGLGAAQPPFL